MLTTIEVNGKPRKKDALEMINCQLYPSSYWDWAGSSETYANIDAISLLLRIRGGKIGSAVCSGRRCNHISHAMNTMNMENPRIKVTMIVTLFHPYSIPALSKAKTSKMEAASSKLTPIQSIRRRLCKDSFVRRTIWSGNCRF